MLRSLLLLTLAGCAAAQPEVVLSESVNAEVEHVPVGLAGVGTTSLWSNRKRVTVDEAVLLVRDRGAAHIRKQKVWVGDRITIGSGVWEVVALQPGTPTTPAQITLRRVADR